ncbi:hypothetical protein [Streptomyces sp. NPDC024089]|uniref:hypothetical protein n=1 Tax=Streptomyces sp. NPDC024089 TaxID=3154328 RepID=UPI0033C7070E
MPKYARLATGAHDDPNQAVVDITVIESDLDGGGGSVDWAAITGKPATFAPTIGTTATTAVAGSDSRLTVGAAGTATVRALGTTATTACAGNDARLLTGTATTQADSTATDAAGIVTDLNALLAKLRSRGIITGP